MRISKEVWKSILDENGEIDSIKVAPFEMLNGNMMPVVEVESDSEKYIVALTDALHRKCSLPAALCIAKVMNFDHVKFDFDMYKDAESERTLDSDIGFFEDFIYYNESLLTITDEVIREDVISTWLSEFESVQNKIYYDFFNKTYADDENCEMRAKQMACMIQIETNIITTYLCKKFYGTDKYVKQHVPDFIKNTERYEMLTMMVELSIKRLLHEFINNILRFSDRLMNDAKMEGTFLKMDFANIMLCASQAVFVSYIENQKNLDMYMKIIDRDF